MGVMLMDEGRGGVMIIDTKKARELCKHSDCCWRKTDFLKAFADEVDRLREENEKLRRRFTGVMVALSEWE